MPEPAPDPDGNKLLDSAIIEQDYDSLPGLSNVERDMQTDDPTQADSPTSEPPLPADATPCNQMQHDSQNPEDVAPGLDLLEMIKSIEQMKLLQRTAVGQTSGLSNSRG
jgi:hypothetical protein